MSVRDDEFDAFYQAEYRPIRRLAYLLTGDWAEAEDRAQEALTRTYAAWGRLGRMELPGSYARRVLLNAHTSLIRRVRTARKHTHKLLQPSVSEATGDDGVVILNALRSLPERQRTALILRYFEDRPISEIAALIEAPETTVRSHLHRGLTELRKMLGPSYEPASLGGES